MSLPKDFFGFFFFVLCSPPFSVFASSASRPLLLFFLVLWSLFFSLSLFLSLSTPTHPVFARWESSSRACGTGCSRERSTRW